MNVKNLLLSSLLAFSIFGAVAQEAQLPNLYEVKLIITEPSGTSREATAVVVEGARASLSTNEDLAPAGTLPLKIEFSVLNDPDTAARIMRDAAQVSLALSEASAGEWKQVGSPKLGVVLGSKRYSIASLQNTGYSISVLTSKIDPTPYREKILALAEKSPNCASLKPGKRDLGGVTPTIRNDPCCCNVTCSEQGGWTWRCCNVTSCHCGSNSCSPAGGSQCY